MTTRRDFLRTSTLLGFGATVPTFLGRTALAAPRADKPGAKDTVLVVVQLTGGNISRAAQIAGRYRADFYKLLRKYGLHPGDGKGARAADREAAAERDHGSGESSSPRAQ